MSNAERDRKIERIENSLRLALIELSLLKDSTGKRKTSPAPSGYVAAKRRSQLKVVTKS